MAAARRSTLGLATWLLVGCAILPPAEHGAEPPLPAATRPTPLDTAVVGQTGLHPGVSGIHPLADARDSLVARLVAVGAAERTLDLQYYLWHDDLTGGMLFEAVMKAAARGVRVRLLLDDNNTAGLDPTLAMLAAQPGIEVRLFNPFLPRSPRWISFVTDFARVDRRMHNKSLTADDRVTIVGGRNIGDEYFGATDGILFADLDVLAIGPIVDDVSTEFARYWASPAAYPVTQLLPRAPATARADFETARHELEARPDAAAYRAALRDSTLLARLQAGDFTWAPTRVVSDDPAKVADRERKADRVIAQIGPVIGDVRTELQIVSPYFVPTAVGVAELTGLARGGADVSVLTNSLEATDVVAVHAGYAKWRKSLLAAGIHLFELRRAGDGDREADVRPARERGLGSGGSSGASLHAKTFAADRSRMFVGSFNFDPRSARLNTEMGFVIDSPELAGQVADAFRTTVPERAYEVRLDASGELVWIERHGAETVTHRQEPGTGLLERTLIRVLSHLPIDDLL